MCLLDKYFVPMDIWFSGSLWPVNEVFIGHYVIRTGCYGPIWAFAQPLLCRERESQRPMQWMSHSPPSLPNHPPHPSGPPSPHTHTPCFSSTDSMGPHTHTHTPSWTYTHRAPGGFLPIVSVVAKPVNMSPLWITANGSYSYACLHTVINTWMF